MLDLYTGHVRFGQVMFVFSVHSEMKSLSVQVKDLTKTVSAVKSDDSATDVEALAQRMSNVESDLHKDIKDACEVI